MSDMFESEIRRFVPVRPTRELESAVSAALARGSKIAPGRRTGDRMLIGAMSMGMAAAVAIVAMISFDSIEGHSHSIARSTMTNSPADGPALAQTRGFLLQFAAGNDPANKWLTQ